MDPCNEILDPENISKKETKWINGKSKLKKNRCGIMFGLWLRIQDMNKRQSILDVKMATWWPFKPHRRHLVGIEKSKKPPYYTIKGKKNHNGPSFKDDTSAPQWNWFKLVPTCWFFTAMPLSLEKLSSTRLRSHMMCPESANCFLYLRYSTETRNTYTGTGGAIYEGTIFPEMKKLTFMKHFKMEKVIRIVL